MNFSQTTAIVLFRIVIPLLVITTQFLIYRKAGRWARETYPRARWLRKSIIGAFLVFNLPLVFMLVARPEFVAFPDWFLYTGVYPYLVWQTASFFVGFLLLLAAILKLPITIPLWITKRLPQSRKKVEALTSSDSYRRFDASRRIFIRRSMYGITAMAVSGTAYGMILGRKQYEINAAEFAIKNLPPGLENFSISFVSDIHSSLFMSKEQMVEYVGVINSLNSDIIVVGGDFVNSYVREVYPFAEAFSDLRAPLGVFGVMGNHDFYVEDPDRVAREIDDCGVKLLRNDKTLVQKDGGRFYLVGVDDPGRNSRTPIKFDDAIGYAPEQVPRILLCHRPYYLKEAAEKRIDLVLSGHTHGGQVVFGKIGDVVIAPATLASPYVWGKYSHGDTQMYVSRGIGTVGPPVRLNCPPEITRIVLRAAS